MILKVHEEILRATLDSNTVMSPQTLNLIIWANKFSDVYQFSPERHFDNAPNRVVLCDRWKHGMNHFMKIAVENCAPCSGYGYRIKLKNRRRALNAFGVATHALADFYAHTNWVELNVVQGDTEKIAPLYSDYCSIDAFPEDLQSGYFNLRYGLQGCPKLSPPIGYAYCHEQLNKDHPTKGHGAEIINTLGRTYHELAVELAIEATLQLWESLCQQITERYRNFGNAVALLRQLTWGDAAKRRQS